MINILKGLLSSKKTKNFAFASINQFINQLIFLLTIPYLTRVLGMEKFGICMSAITLSNYFLVVVDYGFFYTATKEIAGSEHNHELIKKTYNTIFFLKSILILGSILVFSMIMMLSSNYNEYWPSFLWAFSAVIGNLLIPAWLFQGLEMFGHLAFFNFISRAMFVGGVFILVTSPQDFLFVNIFYAIGTWISGLVCVVYIFNKFKLKIFLPKYNDLKSEIIQGSGFLFNNIIYWGYSNSGTILLGYTSNMVNVGYFATAEKVLLAFRQFQSILSQVIYPHVCKIYTEKLNLANFYKKYIVLSTIFSILIGFGMYLFRDQIIFLISGQNASPISSTCLKFFSFIPLLLCINSFRYYFIVIENRIKKFTLYYAIVLVFNIIITILLTKNFDAIGASVSLLVTECIMTIVIYFLSKDILKTLN